MNKPIVWVDIPVIELDRAISFYSALLGTTVQKETAEDFSFAVFPHGETDVGACLYTDEDNQPSRQGPLIYLNVDKRMDQAIKAAESSGGKLLESKRKIGAYGYRAIILDSEGNRIALHETSE